MSNTDEEKRILEEYEKRDARMPWNDWKTNIYHPRHPIGKLIQEHNHNLLSDALNQLDLDLSNLKILDIGCGYGYWLRHFVELGANPKNLVGIDLAVHRIDVAKQKNPAIRYLHHNVATLPFPSKSFDFVMQSVVFSSILDAQMRTSCATEMYRVTKAGGIIFWIDLTHSASDLLVNISESDVRRYFPKMQVIYNKRILPRYFYSCNEKCAWLAKLIYLFTKYGCTSQLLILRKSSNGLC